MPMSCNHQSICAQLLFQPMIPTYVFGWPTGQETGEYLALDLGTQRLKHDTSSAEYPSGGTNLRVCLVTLNGSGKFEITQSKYRLTEEQKQDEGQKLFDFCAECIKTFIESNMGSIADFAGEENKIPLGFTVCSLQSVSVRFIHFGFFSSPIQLRESWLRLTWKYSLTVTRQERIDHGVLIRWTKGFGAPNTEGQDVTAMFRKSLDKHVRHISKPLLPAF